MALNRSICCKYDKKYEKKSYKSSEIQRSNERRRVIKWEEDSQVTIVTKVVSKNLFSQAVSENLCAAGSKYVPILAAAMGIFFRIGL